MRTPDLKVLKAITALSPSSDFQVYIEHLQERLRSMEKSFAYASPEEIHTFQGRVQELREQLNTIETAPDRLK